MKKANSINCLAITHPEIAKQWHFIKNMPLTPYNVTYGSGRKVWWKCDKSNDHEWESTIQNRTNGNGCPCCVGQKAVLSNCLATTHSEVSKQWHPIKNNNLTPYNFVAKSNKKVWWKCDKADDHEWQAIIYERTNIVNPCGCPYCSGHKVVLSNCLATIRPDIIKEWHPTKNIPLTPFDVIPGSFKNVWWKCEVSQDHEWQATIVNRVKHGTNCPCCAGQKVVLSNCLSTINPDLSKQWHPTKNLSLTTLDVTANSGKRVWWFCEHHHEWQATIASRANGNGCPFCSQSIGEKTIKQFLYSIGISYDTQKKFDTCKNKRALPFDFYLPQFNALIEYDGIQHFKPIKYFGGTESFILTQENDKIKNEFATNNNIPLLRIPYTKNDIQYEIKTFISSLTKITFSFLVFIIMFLSSEKTMAITTIQKTIDSLQVCLKTSKDDSMRAIIFRETGLVYVNMGNYPKAIEYFLKSKNLFSSIKNEYGVFRCQSNLGVTYCYMGDYKTALDYLLHTKKGFEDGLIYDNLGLIYYNIKDIHHALSYWKMALDFYKKNKDKKLIARLLNDIGSMYELIGKSDTAILYYNECLKTSNDKMNLSGAFASLGDIYYKQTSYSKSLQYEYKSLKLAKEIGDLISVRETEKILSDIYLKMGDCKTSLLHYKNYILTKDSLVNEDNIKQIVRVEESSRFDKEKAIQKIEQDKKDEIKQEELHHQENQRNIFIGVSGIVLCFSFFLFLAFKRNQKAKIIITEQKAIVDEQKKDILDSIIYASRIQRAILPPIDFIEEVLPEHLIFFQPKDSVSGDFYFVDKISDKIFWASCDATGHSVNGGMLSMLSMNILTEIIKEGETIPSKILDKLNERFNKSLHKKDDNSVRDGLDITICCLDKNTMQLNFAGANNPLWIIKDGIIIEHKTDKMPIGQIDKKEPYTNHTVQLGKGSIIYTFSDGICDLHSKENKKFMKKRFRELLLSVQYKSMAEQKNIISETLNKFKGEAEQVDDMLLIGIKI